MPHPPQESEQPCAFRGGGCGPVAHALAGQHVPGALPLPHHRRHDGIDTQVIRPDPVATPTLTGRLRLDRGSEIITFVNCNLEPFARLPHLHARLARSCCGDAPGRVLLVGGNDVSYGLRPESAGS